MKIKAFGAMVGMALLAAAALLNFGLSTAVVAAESELTIEEIIVTARKREESAQEVPVAITALSEELTRSTIRNLSDLNGFAPNVRIDADPGRNNGASIIIRGISPTRVDDNSFDSPIGVMIDGVYLGTLGGQNLENFDVERVEILRGPQGTLFGKNTVGGVVQVIRSRPTGELGARVKVSAGKWDQKEVRAVLNAPLVEDKLAGKVFFTSIQNDGFMRNDLLEKRMPETDYQNYGITLLATPNDRFEALFTMEKYDDDSEIGASLTNWNLAAGVVPVPTDPREPNFSGGFLACTLRPVFGVGTPCRTDLDIPSSTEVDINNPAKTEVDAYTLNMSFDINDSWRLVSVTGFRDLIEDRKFDFDGSSADYITIERLNDYDQFSQELRVEGDWNNVSLSAGGYYWRSEFEQDWVTGGEFWNFVELLSARNFNDNVWLPLAPPPPTGDAAADAAALARYEARVAVRTMYPTPLEACYARGPGVDVEFGNVWCDDGAGLDGYGGSFTQRLLESQVTKSIAFYAQADWEFSPGWILTAGLRWTEEKKDFMAGQAYLSPVPRQRIKNFPLFVNLKNKWTEVSPKVGLSYQFTDDILFYSSYSEGFHSGGFFGVNQNIADFERNQYDPEYANSWEAGMKSQLLDNRIQLNVAYFFNDFEDKQEQAVQLDTTTNTVATVFSNVATATYQGIEAELQMVVNEYLNVFASFGWLDAEYDEFETDINPNDDGVVGLKLEDASFLTPRNAPEFTIGVGGTFTYPVGPGEMQLYAKYDWIDEIETNLLNIGFTRLDSRDDLSASIGYHYNNMSLTLYGRNLTDEQYEVPAVIAPLFASGTVNPGASWGLEFAMEL
ncbi:MAG: TonB-dependent receptor [Gammaproteobacteria bacterium]|nr:TonB-dependent receptor [Gammaproteobacteria bacterium]MYG13957.1 TonB-dependent receptor [Gammaproteobacteria bacterium]